MWKIAALNNFLESLVWDAKVLHKIGSLCRFLSTDRRENRCGQRNIDGLHQKFSRIEQFCRDAAIAKTAIHTQTDIVNEFVNFVVLEHVEWSHQKSIDVVEDAEVVVGAWLENVLILEF